MSGDDIVRNAGEAFNAPAIVLGHANHPGVTTVFDRLLELLTARGLQTATLSDVFKAP